MSGNCTSIEFLGGYHLFNICFHAILSPFPVTKWKIFGSNVYNHTTTFSCLNKLFIRTITRMELFLHMELSTSHRFRNNLPKLVISTLPELTSQKISFNWRHFLFNGSLEHLYVLIAYQNHFIAREYSFYENA